MKQESIFSYELPNTRFEMEFPLGLLPEDESVGGEDPSKRFVKWIGAHDGGLVPIQVQGEKTEWAVLYGGEIVKAARAAGLATLRALVYEPGQEIPLESYAAYDNHGQLTLIEKVMICQRMMSDDKEDKEIADALCTRNVREVVEYRRIAEASPAIVSVYLAGKISDTMMRKIAKRPRSEQSVLAGVLQLNGELRPEDIKVVRAELAKSSVNSLVPLWALPEMSDVPYVLRSHPQGDGVEVEVQVGGETRIIKIPVGKILEYDG